jgi:hypothetical protein
MVAEKYYKVDDIAPMLKSLSEDTTCPIHIAAELDQIAEGLPQVWAVEVRYGVWLDAGKNMYGQNLTQCSVCHSNSIEGGWFCRCCGALMKN